MSKQPKALRLADHLECNDASMEAQNEAAAELRRLHEEVQAEWRINGMSAERELKLLTEKRELLEALKRIAEIQNVHPAIRDIARAAIAKAEGKTK